MRLATALFAMWAGIACSAIGRPGPTLAKPASPQAVLGQPVEFTVSHCGLKHVVDFDGSFWDVVEASMTAEEEQKFGINSDRGSLVLRNAEEAVYASATGGEATLRRHHGPKKIFGCM